MPANYTMQLARRGGVDFEVEMFPVESGPSRKPGLSFTVVAGNAQAWTMNQAMCICQQSPRRPSMAIPTNKARMQNSPMKSGRSI